MRGGTPRNSGCLLLLASVSFLVTGERILSLELFLAFGTHKRLAIGVCVLIMAITRVLVLECCRAGRFQALEFLDLLI